MDLILVAVISLGAIGLCGPKGKACNLVCRF